MLTSTLVAAALAVATTVTSIVPAQAGFAGRVAPTALAGPQNALVQDARHFRGPRHRYLRPQQVRRILRHRGYRGIRFRDRTPPVYHVRAHGWRGPVVLVVSARNGRIIDRRRVRRHF